MFRIINHKLTSNNTNIYKRKYHIYLKESKFYAKQSRLVCCQISHAIDYEVPDKSQVNHLKWCIATSLKCGKKYILLKKLDENQEIFKSDYDSEILEAIEVDKYSNITNCFVTPVIYAKFDKFKQSIE